MLHAADGDVMLLHRLEQCALRLRRRAVDFIGEQDVRENGAGLELERLPPVRVLRDHVRAHDVRRHEVGRELHAREFQIHRIGQRADEHRFAQPRHAFEQHMAAGEKRGEHAFHDRLLPDHHLRHLIADAREAGCELSDLGFEIRAVAHGSKQ